MTGTLLGIIGILSTIILGYYGIYITIKNKPIPSLTIKRIACFSLFSSVVRKLKIDIKYLDEDVTNPLILFKAEITNSGNLDIDESAIHEPLKITSSEKYSWLEINPINEKSKVNTDIKKLDNRTIEIKWDLLKKNEKIEFEALIESYYSDDEFGKTKAIDFYNSLNYSYRITNIDKIICDDGIYRPTFLNKELINDLRLVFVTIILGIFFLFFPKINDHVVRSGDFVDMYYDVEYLNKDSSFVTTIVPVNNEKFYFRIQARIKI